MALTLAVTVTRDELGLADLNINDHLDYKVANQFMGGAVAWQKQTVSSPYMDGDLVVSRRRGDIVEPIDVYVYGSGHADLRSNTKVLIQAFTQENFNLAFTFDGNIRQYSCKCADYSVAYDQHLVHSKMHLVKFMVPRNPVAVSGGVN